MGYPSRIAGRIDLETPYAVTHVPPPAVGYRVKFEVQELPVLNESRGTLFRKRVVAIVPADEEKFTAYNLEDELKELRSIARAAGVTNFHGYIYRIGDEPGDVQRFSFEKDNHRMVIEDAILAWPDGTPVGVL